MMSLDTTVGRFQVWHLRIGEAGGHRLMSAVSDKATQEKEMTHWVTELPDALLVYRTRLADGTWHQELHLDRTLDSIRFRLTA